MASPGTRKQYQTDVSDEEWAFAAPYLTLMEEKAPQRVYSLREVFNGLRYLAKGGTPWGMIPHDLPPWDVVYQQTQRWIRAQVFEAMVQDLREVLRLREGRKAQPTAAIMDRLWTAARCSLLLEAAAGAGTTAANEGRGAKFTSP